MFCLVLGLFRIQLSTIKYDNFVKILYNIISMKIAYTLLIVGGFLIIMTPGVLAMSSANYQINWDSINSGGDDVSSSANYTIQDTLGQAVSGQSTSANYDIRAGYRLPEGIEYFLAFDVQAQDGDSQVTVANAGFDSNNKTVQVSDASGFSVGNFIGVIEDKGGDQEVAVGLITVINANTITVDAWEGDNATMTTIDGTNDYAYEMTTNLINLGQMTSSQISTGISMVDVSTNASGGYIVQFKEDHNLAISVPGPDFDDVGDANVDGNTEEYGVETIGQDAQGANDWAITGAAQNVALDPAEAINRRTIISYKAATDTGTVAGFYSHTVTYTCVATF